MLRIRKALLLRVALPLCMPLALMGVASPQGPASLTAAQIIDKTVSAKGGLQAWRAVQAMSFSGKMEAGGKDARAAAV